ncbi:NaCP60E, partial [Symbiodinium microadriaticum]
FAFLKAFLLDKDLATIVVEPYYEELSESKEKEQFEELPLCIIKDKYKNVEGGDKFLQELVRSQAGKKHPQFDDDNWKLYKVFKSISTSSSVG